MSCRGKHRKSTRPVRAVAPGVTAAAAAAGIIFSPIAAHARVIPEPGDTPAPPNLANVTAVIQKYVPKHQGAEVIVRRGDTLGKISQEVCGTPGDWTGIYMDNKKVIGGDPNLIIPGQKLEKDCRTANIPQVTVTSSVQYVPRHASVSGGYPGGGNLSFAGLENLWESAGGDSWAAASAARVAECESGGQQYAHNPSGASGYWQILGEVVPGNVYDPMTNARNAVSKFDASGKTWSQWVCRP